MTPPHEWNELECCENNLIGECHLDTRVELNSQAELLVVIRVPELKGLHAGANTQSGDFSLEAEGFLVVDGKKTRPVKNITVGGDLS